MRRLVYALALALAANPVSIAALQEDACARLTSAEAEAILNAAVGRPRGGTKDLATECSYETTGSADRRIVLTVSVYETGRAGLRGSAANYFTEVRRTSMHMRLPMQSVDIGDEGYWMGGVLHVRHGQDLALAIEVAGATAGRADEGLAVSTKVATIILGKLDASRATRETLTIATNTQAHRKDLRIAVGNIWEESYTPEGGTARTGLTAMLDMGVPQDPSRHQHVRVHPGQTLRVFGYVIEIISVEQSGVRLALEREPRQIGR